jgi:hypothetical protein
MTAIPEESPWPADFSDEDRRIADRAAGLLTLSRTRKLTPVERMEMAEFIGRFGVRESLAEWAAGQMADEMIAGAEETLEE